ncbi:uncharacterized protein C10orf120 homolog [Lepus europaeus]|uniref:uncharacterized protein C10orf120 homolog n=1 Tax=Lepus europaeus TaxID=9983 RepID=UPI002B49F883|nr:uncharacterized protein C10orf120 homolog [Lepus europaeus]
MKDKRLTTMEKRLWNQFCQADPRITFGKYSSLEKEILRLGGTHTVATRKFLAHKQEEERKMLMELQLLSPDYAQAMECNRRRPIPCLACGPPEKVWTARVIVSPEEFRMPQREKITIYKHIERMQLARALRNKQLLTYVERLRGSSVLSRGVLSPTAKDKARQKQGSCGKARPEDEEAAPRSPRKQEMQVNVAFKSEEPKQCFVCQPKDCKSFFPRIKAERSIAGQTNRNLVPLAEFPGDLMLMNQDFVSRGINPCDVTRTCSLGEEHLWNGQAGKAAPYN